MYADAQDDDRALSWLERGYAERDPWLVHLRGPDWAGLRPDPRFQDLLKRISHPPL
jgi:hypothetical protein